MSCHFNYNWKSLYNLIFLIIIIKVLPRSTICNTNFNYTCKNTVIIWLFSFSWVPFTESNLHGYFQFKRAEVLLCIAQLLPCGWYIFSYDRKNVLLSYYIMSLSSLALPSVHRHIGFRAMTFVPVDWFLWNFLCVQRIH